MYHCPTVLTGLVPHLAPHFILKKRRSVPSVSYRADPAVVHQTTVTAQHCCNWCLMPLCTYFDSHIFSEIKDVPWGGGGQCPLIRLGIPLLGELLKEMDICPPRHNSCSAWCFIPKKRTQILIFWAIPRPHKSKIKRLVVGIKSCDSSPCTVTVNQGSRVAHTMYNKLKKNRTQKLDVIFQGCRWVLGWTTIKL